jgi:type IV pilus assembly protein PilW
MNRQRGMSLVEVMVAVVIGLIGMIVIFQMYSVAEGRKRAVASGSDMDIAGRLGLMTLERDVQQAGYGYGVAASATATLAGPALGCTVTAYDGDRPTPDFTFTFTPVEIVDGAAGAPDTIAVLKGSSNFLAVGKIVDTGTATTTRVRADTGGRTGVQRGDVVITINTVGGVACGLFEITNDTNPDQLTFDHADGSYLDAGLNNKTARFNKAGGIAFNLAGEGRMYNMGTAPARNVWSVANNRLVVANDLVFTDADGDTVNDQREATDLVVNLQAQYGVDADNNGMIASGEWTNAAPADWTRLLAVRFALLTRGQQFERDKVTNAVPVWSAGAFAMTNLDGTPDSDPSGGNAPNNWRHYRYNVFEAVVPLRNTILGRQL